MSKTPTQNTPARTTRSTPRLPHLHRDRHGTFYFRLTIDGKTIKRSLGTKDRGLATMKASALNWEWSMSKRSAEPSVSDIINAFKKDGREFDAEFPDGTKFKGINTDDDMRRAKDLMLARIEAIGPIEPVYAPCVPNTGSRPAGPQAHRQALFGRHKALPAGRAEIRPERDQDRR